MSGTVRKPFKQSEARETESVSATDSNVTLGNVRWCSSTRLNPQPIPKIKRKKPRTPISPLPVPALMAAYLEKSAARENQKKCYPEHAIRHNIRQRAESTVVAKEQRTTTRPVTRRANQPPRWDSTAKVVNRPAPALKSRPVPTTKHHEKKLKPIYNTK